MLGVLRNKVDILDNEIMLLLHKRLQIVEEIGHHKREVGLPVVDPVREAQVLARLAFQSQELNIDQDYLSDVYSAIFRFSREVQEQVIYNKR